MLISVIIAAYRKPHHLDRALEAFGRQGDTHFEIVVADDGSGQAVRDVIDRHKATKAFDITHVWQEDRGFRKTTALNRAIRKARGEYLIFTDDDCLPASNFVATHRKHARPGTYIVGSYNRLSEKVSEAISVDAVRRGLPFSLMWLMTRGYFPKKGFLRLIVPEWLGEYLDRKGKVESGRFTGGNASVFLEDVLRVGGFNETMRYGREDREFGTRLHHAGLKVRRIKNTTYVLHLHHERDYFNPIDFAENEAILEQTIARRRIQPDD